MLEGEISSKLGAGSWEPAWAENIEGKGYSGIYRDAGKSRVVARIYDLCELASTHKRELLERERDSNVCVLVCWSVEEQVGQVESEKSPRGWVWV